MAVSLKSLNRATENEFANYAMRNVFSEPKTFNELCQASGAVVRDFLYIFRSATAWEQSAAAISQRSASAAVREQAEGLKPISMYSVRLATKQVYDGKRSGFAEGSRELNTLDNIYQRVVVEKESYYFLVDRILATHSTIVALFMAKLIHWTPASYFNPTDSKEYRYYQIDYGSYVDRLAYQEKQKGSDAGRALIRMISNYPLLAWAKALEEPIQALTGVLAEYQALARPEAGRIDQDPTEVIIDETFIAE